MQISTMQIRTETARSYRTSDVDLINVARNVQTGVTISERSHERSSQDRSTQERSAHGIEHVLSLAEPVSNFNTNTMGRSTFVRVAPMSATEQVVADPQLQSKLEALCESLRARY